MLLVQMFLSQHKVVQKYNGSTSVKAYFSLIPECASDNKNSFLRTTQKGKHDKDRQEMMSCSAEKEKLCVQGKKRKSAPAVAAMKVRSRS